MKTNANSLTGAILNYIRYNGSHAERVNNIARQVKSKSGAMVHIPSANFKGTADIHAVKKILLPPLSALKYQIYGQFVAIEVKQKDKQSEAQKYYQECVTKAGGVYMIVRNFDEFLKQWNEI